VSSFKRHVTSLQHSYRAKLNRMSWLPSAKNKLSLENKVKIYTRILAPSLFYAIQVYGNTAKTHLNKIRVLQAKTLRMISRSPWYIRTRNIERDLKVPKIGDRMQAIAQKYTERLGAHPNCLARRLNTACHSRRVRRRLKRHHPPEPGLDIKISYQNFDDLPSITP